MKKAKQDKLQKKIVHSVIEALYRDEVLSIDDISDKKKLNAKLKEIIHTVDFGIVVTHTEDLIKTAKAYTKAKDYNKAKLFYATFFEHALNEIINIVCSRKGIDKKTINQIIRSSSMTIKLTWLPLLLDIPIVIKKHKNIILKLSDDRNAFIHYKFNIEPDDIDNNKEIKILNEISQIEKTITYFKKYSTKICYKNKKAKLKKIITDTLTQKNL